MKKVNREQVFRIVRKLNQETAALSSPTSMRRVSSYTKLAKMGRGVLPALIDTLSVAGSWALITLIVELAQEDIIKEESIGKYDLVVSDIMEWGRASGNVCDHDWVEVKDNQHHINKCTKCGAMDDEYSLLLER